MWVKTMRSISRWRHLLMWQPEAHRFLLQKILFFHSLQIWITKTKFVNSEYRYLQKPCYNKHPLITWNLNRQMVIKTGTLSPRWITPSSICIILHILLTQSHSIIAWYKYCLQPCFGRSNSVGRAIYCRAGGRGFDWWGKTYTQGLKITKEEGISFALQTARYLRSSDHHAL